MSKANPRDVVAFITVEMHASGAMSIKGNIGDKRLAVAMLDHARDAVKNQPRPEDDKRIVLPGRDVVVEHHTNYPVVPAGDMP